MDPPHALLYPELWFPTRFSTAPLHGKEQQGPSLAQVLGCQLPELTCGEMGCTGRQADGSTVVHQSVSDHGRLPRVNEVLLADKSAVTDVLQRLLSAFSWLIITTVL